MFRGMFNPVLGRSNEKDRARENGYFSIPLQREELAVDHFHEAYREMMILAVILALVAGVLSWLFLVADWPVAFVVCFTLACLLVCGAVYLAVDRVVVTRRIVLDVHADRSAERETFRETEDMYSIALAQYLRFKEGKEYDIKQLEIFAKIQELLLAKNDDVTGFDYGKDK